MRGRRRPEGRALANASHLRLLQQGARALDAWRKVNSGVPLDLSGAELAGLRLAGADLGGANLADADLSDADLSGASLFGASLVRAKLTGANLPGVQLRKADLRKADLRDANLTGADLEGADLAEARFGKAKLGAANLSGASMSGASLQGADLGSAKLRGTDLRNADLEAASLQGADLHRANLLGAVLRNADLSGASLTKAKLREGAPGEVPAGDGEGTGAASAVSRADLKGAKLNRVDFRGSDLTGLDLQDADMRDTQLQGVSLAGAALMGADLGGAQMEEADVRGCDFLGVRFDSTTLLRRAKVKGARIDRHTLESLKDYGGLTPGDRMQMKILDGVTLLRSHYSGFWQYIHVFALVLFFYPYGWFVFSQYAVAQSGIRDKYEEVRVSLGTAAEKGEAFVKKNPLLGRGMGGDDPMAQKVVPKERVEIPVWKALLRFIWNGGEGWEHGFDLDPFSFGIFVFSLLYNLLRFVMVFKTAELMLHQEASGLPVPVSALGIWGRLVHIMEIGFCINVVLVLFHTFHFLRKPIILYIEKL
jgi:uncharacterized protein YjbI with pentapeptide repeats